MVTFAISITDKWASKFGSVRINSAILFCNGDVATVMNINEILAKRANEILTGKIDIVPLKPNDHVSCNQATTDVLMSSAHITCYNYMNKLQELLAESAEIFKHKASLHKKWWVVK